MSDRDKKPPSITTLLAQCDEVYEEIRFDSCDTPTWQTGASRLVNAYPALRDALLRLEAAGEKRREEIVKSLDEKWGPLLKRLAGAESERCEQEAEAAQQEIARLRDMLHEATTDQQAAANDLAAAKDEIKRLREVLAATQATVADSAEWLAERDRLRDELSRVVADRDRLYAAADEALRALTVRYDANIGAEAVAHIRAALATGTAAPSPTDAPPPGSGTDRR